jgi:hypothetical protein
MQTCGKPIPGATIKQGKMKSYQKRIERLCALPTGAGQLIALHHA